MIRKEFYITREDGVNLYRIYDDEGFCVLQVETGNIYEEAIDVENAPYTYTETNILPTGEIVDRDLNKATERDLYNALAELGVSEDD